MLRSLRTVRAFLVSLALLALLVGGGYGLHRVASDTNEFEASFGRVRYGMTPAQVRKLLGPPDEVDTQPAAAVTLVRRPLAKNLSGTLRSWYYGGSPDDPETDLYVVDFKRGRVFYREHVGAAS